MPSIECHLFEDNTLVAFLIKGNEHVGDIIRLFGQVQNLSQREIAAKHGKLVKSNAAKRFV